MSSPEDTYIIANSEIILPDVMEALNLAKVKANQTALSRHLAARAQVLGSETPDGVAPDDEPAAV